MKTKQVDNSTLRQKVFLRQTLLKEFLDSLVLETHGGYGEAFKRCYSHLPFGVVIEKESARAAHLARQRPGWAVYEAECESALALGLAADMPINLLDVDPYGQPWPVLDAFFGSQRVFPSRLVLAVNDGLRLKLKRGGGWDVDSLAEVVGRRGNEGLYDDYLAVCRELVTTKAALAGYSLSRWMGYYCGFNGQMTHYAAILTR